MTGGTTKREVFILLKRRDGIVMTMDVNHLDRLKGTRHTVRRKTTCLRAFLEAQPVMSVLGYEEEFPGEEDGHDDEIRGEVF